ncbi:MAG: EamA family transporter [Gaiellales bacterium]
MSPRVGYLCVAVAAALWGFNGVFSRIAIDGGVGPLQLGAGRAFAAALILLPFLLPHVRRIDRTMLLPIALFALFGIVLSQGLFFEAISRLNVALALVIVYTAPIPVAAYQRLRRGEMLPGKAYVGMLIAIVGVAMAVLGGAGGFTSVDNLGLVFAFATTAAYAMQVILASRQPTALPPLARTGAALVTASAIWMVIVPAWTLPFGLLGLPEELQGRIDIAVPMWFAVAWVVLLGTVAAYLLFIVGAARIGPGATSVVGMIEPILAAFVAWILLGQSMTTVEIAGIVIAIVAITYVERARLSYRRRSEVATTPAEL